MADTARVIQYEGDNTTFVWKSPIENFTTLSQLVVHESQEAVFFMNGQALDLFGPGRHTLETQNVPLLSKFLNRAMGDTTPFHCEVYFVNKTEQMAIDWGTDDRVQYLEPTFGFPISIGARGQMSLRVEDSRKLLVKLVGTETVLTRRGLVGFFRAFLMTRAKSYIAEAMRASSISIFEVDARLSEFSQAIREPLVADFLTYGIALEQFLVTGVERPETDPQYRRFKDLYFRQYADVAEASLRQQVQVIDAQTEAQKTVIASQAMATKRAQEGYTYQQERGFDVAQTIAQNEAVGQFTNMGVGLGTMTGVGGSVAGIVGGAVSDAVSGAASPAMAGVGLGAVAGAVASSVPPAGSSAASASAPMEEGRFCPSCGRSVDSAARFCPFCGVSLARLVCPSCGGALVPGARFCPSCGTSVGEP